jgi:very-short-patch-repair endonuclease
MYSPTYIVKSAQHMRSRMTTAEGMLWKTLSNWFDDVRFRRQYPIGNHVVDFYCRRLRLIIEISRTGCQVRNERDDAYLRACGYSVLRFTEKEIIGDFPRIVSRVGLRVRILRFRSQLSSVKNIFGCAAQGIHSIFTPRRRFNSMMVALKY